MFFIVSTGRSGTQTLARVLALVDNCVCLHEPAPELILESSGYRYGTVTDNYLRTILLRTRPPRVNGSVYCESNQTLSLIIPVLARTFPNARYIWLIRNGLDVVASTYQKQWYSGHSENHERYEDCPAIEKAWIDGRIEADQCGDMSTAEWRSLDRFGRCCWYWGYVNRLIEADLARYAPGHSILLRLEEIDSSLLHVVRWMGLRVALLPTTRRHNAAKREPYHWSQWNTEKQQIFERFCGELMDTYYPSWRTPDGKWMGVEPPSNLKGQSWLDKHYRAVRIVNKLLARNRT